jgi:hypothetical protein
MNNHPAPSNQIPPESQPSRPEQSGLPPQPLLQQTQPIYPTYSPQQIPQYPNYQHPYQHPYQQAPPTSQPWYPGANYPVQSSPPQAPPDLPMYPPTVVPSNPWLYQPGYYPLQYGQPVMYPERQIIYPPQPSYPYQPSYGSNQQPYRPNPPYNPPFDPNPRPGPVYDPVPKGPEMNYIQKK